MSDEEARALLGGPEKGPSELLSLANGWPAVLALAAGLEDPPTELLDASHLHGFFADEIYRQLPRRTRRRLSEVVLIGVEGRHIALQQMQKDEADRVATTGIACGFLTERGDSQLDVHPLVRAFLLRKLREERPRALGDIVNRAMETLLRHGLWDEAFSVIERFDRDDLLPALLTASLEEILASGRTATLATWVRDSRATAPIVRLATAEVAFREARYYEAEALAALAASDLAAAPHWAAQANFVAGRAANLASRETQARSYYERAGKLAQDTRHARRAALGELVAMIELEGPTRGGRAGSPFERSVRSSRANRCFSPIGRWRTRHDLERQWTFRAAAQPVSSSVS